MVILFEIDELFYSNGLMLTFIIGVDCLVDLTKSPLSNFFNVVDLPEQNAFELSNFFRVHFK